MLAIRQPLPRSRHNMHIETRKLSEIKPYPNNARKIPEAAVEKVALSLRAYGWQQPIVLDAESVIIVGHVRWMAARKSASREARPKRSRAATSL